MTEEIKLHTARLIVRIPRVEDAQAVFTLMKDIPDFNVQFFFQIF